MLNDTKLAFIGSGTSADAIYQLEKGSLRTILSKAI